MNKTIILVTLAILLAAILFLSACASEPLNQGIPEEPAETDYLPDMANPAAVYCEGLGYAMETGFALCPMGFPGRTLRPGVHFLQDAGI